MGTLQNLDSGLWTLDLTMDWTVDSIMDSIVGLEFRSPGTFDSIMDSIEFRSPGVRDHAAAKFLTLLDVVSSPSECCRDKEKK